MHPDKFASRLRIIFIILFAVSSIWSLFNQDLFVFFSSFVILILIILSNKFRNKKGLEIASSVYITFLIFVFLSNFLGEVRFFYSRFWWWDLFLHFSAGILLGLLGFSLIYYINQNSKNLKLTPFFIVFFGFCFSMTLSVFWEFFEFTADMILKTNMLKSGLNDTFGDLIVAMVGAFIVSCFGYFGLKQDYKKFVCFLKGLIKKSHD